MKITKQFSAKVRASFGFMLPARRLMIANMTSCQPLMINGSVQNVERVLSLP